MHLFYFSKQNHERGLKFCEWFVEGFYELTKSELTVFVESDFDLEFLSNKFSNYDKIQIINIYQEINEIQVDGTLKKQALSICGQININQFYFNQPLDTFNNDSYEHLVFKLVLFFKNFINKNHIKFVHFGTNQAFRCLGISIFYELLREEKIPFYMIFNTPVKARHILYNSIYQNSDLIAEIYRRQLEKKIDKTIISDVDNYFDAYRTFKSEDHDKRFEKARNLSRKQPFQFRNFPRRVYNTFFSAICNKRYHNCVNQKGTKKPYILILLNKSNSFLTNYALPYFADVSHVAKSIWLSLPPGHEVVIKDHPLNVFPNQDRISLYELVRKTQGIHYLSGEYDTHLLVKGAKAVAYNCSTSGVEALMQFKHVIAFGKHPVYMDFPNPPVHRVSCIENLPEIIHECLNTPPPKNKIYAYFYALLKASENCDGEKNNEIINLLKDEEYFKKHLSSFLFGELKSKSII